MEIKITSGSYENGKEYYEYSLLDGPGNIEKVHGYAVDLILAFTKIIEWREKISRDYDIDPAEGGDNPGQPGYNDPGESPSQS